MFTGRRRSRLFERLLWVRNEACWERRTSRPYHFCHFRKESCLVLSRVFRLRRSVSRDDSRIHLSNCLSIMMADVRSWIYLLWLLGLPFVAFFLWLCASCLCMLFSCVCLPEQNGGEARCQRRTGYTKKGARHGKRGQALIVRGWEECRVKAEDHLLLCL